MIELQPITYRGRLVAVATSTRFFLSDELEDRTDQDDLGMVVFMCAYAIDIATGQLPGPYRDKDARRYARCCLLAPGSGELLEREGLDIPRAARALGIPTDELCAEIAEHRQRLMPGSVGRHNAYSGSATTPRR